MQLVLCEENKSWCMLRNSGNRSTSHHFFLRHTHIDESLCHQPVTNIMMIVILTVFITSGKYCSYILPCSEALRHLQKLLHQATFSQVTTLPGGGSGVAGRGVGQGSDGHSTKVGQVTTGGYVTAEGVGRNVTTGVCLLYTALCDESNRASCTHVLC